jgi:hypothetical protein
VSRNKPVKTAVYALVAGLFKIGRYGASLGARRFLNATRRHSNTAVGHQTLSAKTTGHNNVAVCEAAGAADRIDGGNLAEGQRANRNDQAHAGDRWDGPLADGLHLWEKKRRSTAALEDSAYSSGGEWRLAQTRYKMSVIRAITIALFCLLDEFPATCDFR